MKWNCGVTTYLGRFIVDYQQKNNGIKPKGIFIHPQTYQDFIVERMSEGLEGFVSYMDFMGVPIHRTDNCVPYYRDHLGRIGEL